ncbi:hypothetical protein L4D21_24455, partial [Photobacterium profundum]|uniref:hypothetical protein n=1 Tax=Photobacterium profundum TaxID=74109 RepID=UPI003D0A2EA5
LLCHLKMPFVLDNTQALRCINRLDVSIRNQVLSPALQMQLLALGQPAKTDQELALSSIYKIMLTADITKTSFPYVNISTPKIELNYCKTCLATEPRIDLINHLKYLCADANKIILCDNYLINNWNNNKALFDTIFPKKKLDIYYVEVPHYFKKTGCQAVRRYSTKAADIKAKCSDWTYQSTSLYTSRHDRYLLIETATSKIEVILSSGFDYLWRTNKEITCVFRQI